MVLEQKEMDVIKELQTQEKSCVEKYRRYKEQACDMERKNLFEKIEKLEQKHYDTLERFFGRRGAWSVTLMMMMVKTMNRW